MRLTEIDQIVDILIVWTLSRWNNLEHKSQNILDVLPSDPEGGSEILISERKQCLSFWMNLIILAVKGSVNWACPAATCCPHQQAPDI